MKKNKSYEKNTESLLKEIDQLLQHQKEIQRIKGESFNIFSILEVETKENKTHSNFIAELLNPEGSHFMGTTFLELFLKEIECLDHLDIKTISVHKEFHIGAKNTLDGGRIDILLKDKKGNVLSIENKIYAGDQDNQLIRYFNYKKNKNKLFYLTLWGHEASEESTVFKNEKGEVIISLEAGKDYQCISYSDDIINWLNACMLASMDQPQIRDSIKQYKLLIKKLTNQMLDPKTHELQKKLLEYHEAAQYISDNFQHVKNDIKERFREDVVQSLRGKLDSSKFDFHYPNPVSKKFAQIFVVLKEIPNQKIQFLIESFSGYGHLNGGLFIGVYDHTAKRNDFPINQSISDLGQKQWKTSMHLTFKEKHISLNDNNFLAMLFDSENFKYKEIVNKVSGDCEKFIKREYPTILDYCRKNQE